MQSVSDQDGGIAQEDSAQALSADEAFDSVASQDDEWCVALQQKETL